ncbi:branched-chain amino acid aminotransferase [Pseudonocardia thermophila]|jgi:branched-chain amino acid aminotransferase, group II|uniref:Branched-chain-amino-acid aminotransferase n=1 Tax=Pseudonocardia thermophila TaxID=1848 RepID=A0A1M6R2V2_PSETH|nr:branched-chain amino acid aminotransferase [Pseudonocardia thermophila]SHK26835.1 branched-chain amino acid aminotransferase [Pseudonocardia thermophila]
MTVAFTRTPHPSPTPPERRAEILAEPGFGRYFTDHMVTIRWTAEKGWHDAELKPYGPLTFDPAAMVLHYGQEIFEGLKAYRQPDGSIACFRPDANAARFRRSAARLAMAELPDELFLESIRQLLDVDRDWVPAAGGEDSLYLRPFMLATEVGLGVRPSAEYLYVLIASPAGPYFAGGVKPVDVWLSTDYTRAALGGTGTAKCGGNYAASLLPQSQGAEHGCAQVAYLDAEERTWVEEMGSNNLFFVFGSGDQAELVTPTLSGSILPGITRDALLVLAKEIGCEVTERRISGQEWFDGARDGRITEVFGCGTAAVITPIGRVKSHDDDVVIGGGEPGPVTLRLRELLTSIQRGEAPDTHSWMYTMVPA